MSFLYTIASVLFANTILWSIFRAINFRHHRKVYLIIISVCELGSILYFAIIGILTVSSMMAAGGSPYEVALISFYFLAEAAGILTGYMLTIALYFKDVKLFKSRRQRQFEREARDKKQRIKAAILFYGGLSLVALALIGLGIASYVLLSGLNVYFYIFVIAGVLLLIFLLVYFIVTKPNTNQEVKKGNVLFFVKTNGQYYIYSGELDGDSTIESKLGDISIEYMLTDFGILVENKDKIRVFGITPSEFDARLLNTISLEKEEKDYTNIFNEFNRYQRKKIVLDENRSIKTIVNI